MIITGVLDLKIREANLEARESVQGCYSRQKMSS